MCISADVQPVVMFSKLQLNFALPS